MAMQIGHSQAVPVDLEFLGVRRTLLCLTVMVVATELAGKGLVLGLGIISWTFAVLSFGGGVGLDHSEIRRMIVQILWDGARYSIPPILVHSLLVLAILRGTNNTRKFRRAIPAIVIVSTLTYAVTACIIDGWIEESFFDEPIGVFIVYVLSVISALLGGWALMQCSSALRRREREKRLLSPQP